MKIGKEKTLLFRTVIFELIVEWSTSNAGPFTHYTIDHAKFPNKK